MAGGIGAVVQTAVKQPMSKERIEKQLGKTGNTPYYFENLEVETGGSPFVPVQELNELRRSAFEQLTRRYCVHTAGRYRKIGRAGQEKDGKIRKKRIWKKITRQVRNQKKPARLRTLNSQQIYLYRARKRCLRIKRE